MALSRRFLICFLLWIAHQATAQTTSWLEENRRYIAAHKFLPHYFFNELGPERILNAIERGDNDTFIPVWFAAGFQFTPQFVYQTHDNFRIGLISLPAPRKATEAYMAVFVGRKDDPEFGRYFLLELTDKLFTDGPTTMVTEWDREHKHHNYGKGPAFEKDFDACVNAFMKRVIELIAKK
jgi:hypothetical protein